MKNLNLYQLIFKTLLKSVNKKQQHQQQQQQYSSNTHLQQLQNILISNQLIWDWDDFFEYLNNTNNETTTTIVSNKYYILKLKEEIQIELLNWFLILINNFDNENCPSTSLVLPIVKLRNWIQNTYINDAIGYNIYKSNQFICFLIDSLLSTIDFNLNSTSNTTTSNTTSNDNNNTINLYYPFSTTFGKDIDDELKQQQKQLSLQHQQKQQQQDDGIQELSLNINNFIKLFENNKWCSDTSSSPYVKKRIISISDDNNDHHTVSNKEYINIDDDDDDDQMVIDDKDDKDDSFNLHLQDWSIQFQTLLPNILNNNNNDHNEEYSLFSHQSNKQDHDDDDYDTTTKKQTTTTTIPKNTNAPTTVPQQQSSQQTQLENEEITRILEIKSQFINEDGNSTTTTAIPSSKLIQSLLLISNISEVIKLLEANTYSDENFIIFLKEIIQLDFSYLSISQYFNLLLLPRLKTSNIGSTREMSNILNECLIKHQSSFIGSVLIPLLLDTNNTTNNITNTTNNKSSFQKQHFDIIKKLISNKNISLEIKSNFFTLLVSTILNNTTTTTTTTTTNTPIVWNQNLIQVFTSLIILKPILNEKVINDFLDILLIQSKLLSKDTQFYNIIFHFILGYMKSLKEFTNKLQQIITNIELPTVSVLLQNLEKIKKL